MPFHSTQNTDRDKENIYPYLGEEQFQSRVGDRSLPLIMGDFFSFQESNKFIRALN